ncbi:MAG: OmpA family protein [Pseudomonadota bacterium]
MLPNTPVSRLPVLVAMLACALPSQAASDADGDGVADRDDVCAHTAAGATVDNRGCEFDDDGDGVVDRLDTCPATRRGALVNTRGCEPDSDSDGIADRLDRCPGSAPTSRIDSVGCQFKDVVPLRGLRFDTGSADVASDSRPIVRDAAQLINRYPELCFVVEGYTDNVGSASNNLRLSRERATSVESLLVAFDADSSRLSSTGFGENNPVASNRTAAGREQNRRVSLRVQESCP